MITLSTQAKDNFYRISMLRATGKRLSQKDRIFVELYTAGKNGLARYFFHRQMKPAICNASQRINELRADGFVIATIFEGYKDGEKCTRYVMDTERIEVKEPKRKGFFGLW